MECPVLQKECQKCKGPYAVDKRRRGLISIRCLSCNLAGYFRAAVRRRWRWVEIRWEGVPPIISHNTHSRSPVPLFPDTAPAFSPLQI